MPLLADSRVLLRGARLSLALVTLSACAQRISLPLAALWLGDRGPKSALLPLLFASALSFVRARASDHVARRVRLRVVEMFTANLEDGVVVPAPPAEVSSARLATALPVLVSFAVDGIATVLAGLIAVPVVAWLIASSLGKSALFPLVVAGLAGALVTALSAPRLEDTWSRSFDHARNLLALASSAFAGAAELVVHGREKALVESLRAEVVAWSKAELRARTMSALASWGALSATLVAAALTWVLLDSGALLHVDEHKLHVIILLVLASIPTAQMLLGGIGTVMHARSELRALGNLRQAGRSENDKSRVLVDPRAEIRLDHLGYSYPASNAPALREVTFVLPEGESLAIVGPNGAGKTTLLWLLMGLVCPDEGAVFFGETPLSTSAASFGNHIAFVSQTPFEPPDASIEQALCAFEGELPQKTLLEALDEVGVRQTLRARAGSDEAALRLPLAALSRGQARRVMLARALVRDASLVVLDEPEAHLDAEGIAELDVLLRKISRSRRVIAAIHDPDVLGFAHKVLRLS